MNSKLEELILRIRELQAELEAELEEKQEQFRYRLENRRVRFEQDVLELHRRLRTSSLRYLMEARLMHVITAPVVYGSVIPLLLMDLTISVYQIICFSVYGIPQVRRADYFVYDRNLLPYLNTIEKVHCLYCSYGNGLIAYCREIIGRTEQYWCPIKHAHRVLSPHDHYGKFFDYGDVLRYRAELERLRKDYPDTVAEAEPLQL